MAKKKQIHLGENGIALIFALLLAVIIVGILFVGAQFLVTSLQESHKQKAIYAQGEAIAKAGIADALSWFRRQIRQPVASGTTFMYAVYPDAAFFPREDSDTLDESIGLVREERLSPDLPLWARYEVKRQSVNNYADPTLTDNEAVHDITAEKMQGQLPGNGYVWYIESHGYVYAKRDEAKRYDEAPNEVVGKSVISTEFRRITISMPVRSAVIVDTGGSGGTRRVNVINYAKVRGGTGSYGATRRVVSNTPNTTPNGTVSSNYQYDTAITPERIFGVSSSELKLMSDYLVSDVSKLPYAGSKLPGIGIYYIDGNATFNATYPLWRVSGILFVNGNLTITNYDTQVYFAGIIYVDSGTVNINCPGLITGALVANNRGSQNVTIDGSNGVIEINYDEDILSLMRQQLTQYRENKAMYRVISVLK